MLPPRTFAEVNGKRYFANNAVPVACAAQISPLLLVCLSPALIGFGTPMMLQNTCAATAPHTVPDRRNKKFAYHPKSVV